MRGTLLLSGHDLPTSTNLIFVTWSFHRPEPGLNIFFDLPPTLRVADPPRGAQGRDLGFREHVRAVFVELAGEVDAGHAGDFEDGIGADGHLNSEHEWGERLSVVVAEGEADS